MLDQLRMTLVLALAGCGGSPCAESTPILLDDGGPSGFERCADGTVHRVSAIALAFDPSAIQACDPATAVDVRCTVDACGPNAVCAATDGLEGDPSGVDCECVGGCESDADCGDDRACVAPEALGWGAMSRCVTATCRTDDDCESGECGLSTFDLGCGSNAMMGCRTNHDECRTIDDCEDSPTWSGDCRIASGRWACVQKPGDGCDGRLMRVDGEVRVADVHRRTDWSEALVREPDLALAVHWAAVGRLEHASVGSFARVTLQLLALGAPADLVADTQQAAVDEVVHARLAFGLASAYAGERIGPGPLLLDGAMPALDPLGVLESLVDEACVGEVLGAAEAAVAACGCRDPEVTAVLRRIADDEGRHAALAWRTVRWLVSCWPDLRAPAIARLEERLAETREVPALHDPDRGVIGGEALSRLDRDVKGSVIRPLLAGV